MENSRKVTHGCIIATLKLFLPDGKEAKASPTIMNGHLGAGGGNQLPTQDLYLLNQYIQEALAREQLLETKLAILQRLVGQTEEASTEAWKALIDEDRLLTRVEILESQLSAYSKNMTEDKLREETQRLISEKEEYQEVTKATLTKITNDKLDALRKLSELEKQLSASEDEQALLKELYDKGMSDNQRLAEENTRLNDETEQLKRKVEEATAAVAAAAEASATATAEADSKESEEKTGESKNEEEKESELPKETASNEDTAASTEKTEEETTSSSAAVIEHQPTMTKESEAGSKEELEKLQERCSRLESDNAILTVKLAEMQSEERYLSTSQSTLVDSVSSCTANDDTERLKEELREKDKEREELLSRLRELEEESKNNSSSLSLSLVSGGDDEEKIAHLLRVKEKYAELTKVNSELETSFRDLEAEVSGLTSQNQAATFCSLVPLAVLLIAIIVAYLPAFSSLFGTAEPGL